MIDPIEPRLVKLMGSSLAASLSHAADATDRPGNWGGGEMAHLRPASPSYEPTGIASTPISQRAQNFFISLSQSPPAIFCAAR